MTSGRWSAVVLALGVHAIIGCRGSKSHPPVARPPDDMVTIPAGPFRSGCDPAQGCSPDFNDPLVPIHDADVAAFEIDRLEVSVADYRACWQDGPCRAANDEFLAIVAELRGDAGAMTDSPYMRPAPLLDDKIDERVPIYDVSPLEARTYCRWVGKRLPRALEWEKAARGTDGRPHPWGFDPPTPERTSNADWNRWPWEFPLPVGSQPDGASPYGVLDMIGNVAEWVETDDMDPERILIAGGSPLQSEPMHPGVTVLPAIGEGQGPYRRHPDALIGFRCARSVAARPAAK